jgi:hypothetical protein
MSLGFLWTGLQQLFGGGRTVPRPTAAQLRQAAGLPVALPVTAANAVDAPRAVGVQAGPGFTGFTGREELGGEALAEGDAELFIHGEMVLHLDSSWLAYARYFPAAEELEVGLLSGGACRGLVVSQFPMQLALQFAQASSKGRFWWDFVFIRGKGSGIGMNRKTRLPVRWL